MGARTERKLCLNEEDEAGEGGRRVARELRRFMEELRTSSESESPWDEDDEETSMESRCASADSQTRCRQGGLDPARPLTLSCCCRLASKLRQIEQVLARHNGEPDASGAASAASKHEGNSNAQEGRRSGAQPSSIARRDAPQPIARRDAPHHARSQCSSLNSLAQGMQFHKAPVLPRHGASLSFQTSGMKWFS
jgi:hypothetical protein